MATKRKKDTRLGSKDGGNRVSWEKNKKKTPDYLKKGWMAEKLLEYQVNTKQRELFVWDCTPAFVDYVQQVAESRGYISGDSMLRRMGINPDYYSKCRRGQKICSYHYMFWICSILKEPITFYV